MLGSEWPGWLTVSGFIVCTHYLPHSGTRQLAVSVSECAAHLAAVFTYVLLLFLTVRTTPPKHTRTVLLLLLLRRQLPLPRPRPLPLPRPLLTALLRTRFNNQAERQLCFFTILCCCCCCCCSGACCFCTNCLIPLLLLLLFCARNEILMKMTAAQTTHAKLN